jgi:iron complex outermembrane receptor protein
LRRWGAAAAAAAILPLAAQEAAVPVGEPIVVTATRGEERVFDAPASITVVGAEAIRAAGPQVNLSEVLNRVPGITVLNRQNYAQDLQLSIRGFGSRSTFGIRGVRLIVDGIPATMPDGQGQASNVSLPSAARIEVLRGPLAQLYGNAAGGVVQVFTQAGAPQPTLSVSGAAMRYDADRFGAQYAASAGDHALTIDASRFTTDGYREHSAAERSQLNAKWSWQWDPHTRIDTVVNAIDQPHSLDPLGLTRAQWEENPRQSPAIAFLQDASKTVRQQQAGTVVERRLDADTTLTARAYLGERKLENALSTPLVNQLPPTSAGGIVVFERQYAGAALQVSRRVALGEGFGARLVAGLEHDRMAEDRQGYLNVGGMRGELRRDEDNTVRSNDVFAQASLDIGESFAAIAGARASRVEFTTHDHYIAPGNPDDSGNLSFRATNPAAGITWHASPQLNVYANAGRGFETPTFTELAYRNGASGLNTDLKASRSRHAELGVKWRSSAGHAIDAAVFDIRTRDEIVVDTNVGGRSTFRNAGRTTRRGAEILASGPLGAGLRYLVSASALNARFEDGKHLPGTPERSAYAELAYAPPGARGGFNAAIEAVHTGRLFVNDTNDDFAPAVSLLNLRAGFAQRLGGWEVEEFLRIDNATDRGYSGSVIVNEAQRRFFEPAPPRGWMVGLVTRYRF